MTKESRNVSVTIQFSFIGVVQFWYFDYIMTRSKYSWIISDIRVNFDWKFYNRCFELHILNSRKFTYFQKYHIWMFKDGFSYLNVFFLLQEERHQSSREIYKEFIVNWTHLHKITRHYKFSALWGIDLIFFHI